MSTNDHSTQYEYPGAAGSPDGTTPRDEGTAALVEQQLIDAVRQFDGPSTDSNSELAVHRDDSHQHYVVTVGSLELASLRYREVDGRVVLLTTTVIPEFHGRGLAADLIAYALDDIRDRGMHVTVYCRVIAAFMEGNRQYADLIDSVHPGLSSFRPPNADSSQTYPPAKGS